MRRARLARHPALWMGLLALLVLGLLWLASELEPTADADTETYLRAARAPSAVLLLANIRTAGYPLVLRWVAPDEERFWRLPLIHALAYIAAVLLFWRAVRRFTGSGWLAFAAAVPLLFSDVLGLVHRIRPDVLAVAAALATVSFLLALVGPSLRGVGQSPGPVTAIQAGSRPPLASRAALWAALFMALFVTCQLRPSYLLFVPLVPVLGVALRWCAVPGFHRAARRAPSGLAGAERKLLGYGVVLTLAAAAPLVAFAALRWVVVGHFGLVAFGGFNLIGTTATFLDDAVVAELPEEHRRVAAGILERRSAHGWEPLRADAPAREWHPQYNTNVWVIALEALAEKYGTTARRLEDWVEAGEAAPELPPGRSAWRPGGIDVNQELSDLSMSLIRLRPALYRSWVSANLRVALEKVLLRREVLWPAALVAASLIAAPLVRRRRRPASTGERPSDEPGPDAPVPAASAVSGPGTGSPEVPGRRLLGLGLLAAGWCLALLVPLILISIPFDRYIVASVLLVPGALFATLFEVWRRALAYGARA